jgi:hypothetical protein
VRAGSDTIGVYAARFEALARARLIAFITNRK